MTRAGFTLIELILSIGLLSLILLVTFNAIDQGVRSREVIADRAEQMRVADAFLQRLERELSSAYVGVRRNSAGRAERLLPETDFLGLDQEDVVPRDSLLLTCHCGEVWSHGLADSNRIPHTEIAYDFVHDRELDYTVLMRRQDVGIDDDPATGGISDRMWAQIRGMNLRYLDPRELTWRDSWDAADDPQVPLPQAVEVTLWLAPPTANDDNLEGAYVVGHTIILPNVQPAERGRAQ